DREILVAPGLEARVVTRIEAVARLPGGAVPVHDVLLEGVEGREVETAAEPPGGPGAGGFGDEEAHVHVGGGHVRVARVDHQRHTNGFERCTGETGPARAGRGRQRRALHTGEVDPALLDHDAVLEHAGPTSSAAGMLVQVFSERTAVGTLEGGADPV